MKTIYIDSDFKCHVTDDGTLTPVETDHFDGKCDAYIDGCRFVPAGESWTREDGVVFRGEMAAPWRPWPELDRYQREYERALAESLREQNQALLENLAQLVEEVYQSDLEWMA